MISIIFLLFKFNPNNKFLPFKPKLKLNRQRVTVCTCALGTPLYSKVDRSIMIIIY